MGSSTRALALILALLPLAHSATLTFFSDAACAQPAAVAGAPSVSAFLGSCTDIGATFPLTLSSCAAGASAAAIVGLPSPSAPAPLSCSSFNTIATLDAAQDACTPMPPALADVNGFRSLAAFKFTDTICTIPPTVVYATVPAAPVAPDAPCANQRYLLTTADDTCRAYGGTSSFFYKATLSGGAAGGASSLALSRYSDAACPTAPPPVVTFRSVPLTGVCTTTTTAGSATVEMRAAPVGRVTAPSPSASPAPPAPVAREAGAVTVKLWSAAHPTCDGPPTNVVRAIAGVCTPVSIGTDLYDLGVAPGSCTPGAASLAVYNASFAAPGSCAGPLWFAVTAALGGCTPVFNSDAGAPTAFAALAEPAACAPPAGAPDSVSVVTLYTTETAPRGGSAGGPVCSVGATGGNFSVFALQTSGGLGSCTEAREGVASLNYSARVTTVAPSGPSGVLDADIYNSTLAPYGCSGAGGPPLLSAALITLSRAPRDNSCVPAALYGRPVFAAQAKPAVAYPPPGVSLSASPSPSGRATETPSATPSPTPTPPPTPPPTATVTPTSTLSPGAPASASPSAPPSPSPSASAPATPSITPSATATLSVGATPSVSPSASATPSPPCANCTAPAGAAAAPSVVGPAVGGAIGGLILVGGAGAAAALLINRSRVARPLGTRVPRAGGALSMATLNPFGKAVAGASAPAPLAPPAGGAGAAAAAPPVVWSRHTDGEDTWYTSSAGETEWVLPEGANLSVQ